MDIFRIFFAYVLPMSLVIATPVQEVSGNSNQVLEPEEIPELSIEPRVTCDLLGPTGWGDALCAAHCIALGHKGGWCDSHKVCNCR
ncbi:U-Asilidin(12)-Dg3b-like [Lutzomyia longipalpis]|uniref:U-Asilidin(12)-Dg3b-like n=1 Tax=Lutzomyia longipalpis TaxID=7200 RepID=UPI0024842575|nr:U-Asilidin(12)-Dg3b-like [Lutzomyia longipalpis]